MENHNMELLMDLGHYQPFNVTTYTTICKICKNKKFKRCKYYKYNSESGKADYISNISYKKLFVDGNILLSENNSEYLEYLNYDINQYDKVVVKNVFIHMIVKEKLYHLKI